MSRIRGLLTDIRPLQASAAFRRVWLGNTVAQLGQQMTAIAVAIQVYAITHSSFHVGLVGIFALVPMVGFGLYAGALADAMDRRVLALIASGGLWIASVAFAVQALLGLDNVWFLYGVIAFQSCFYAMNQPARSAMIPRLLDKELIPAAQALNMATFNLGITLGPVLGALVIGWHGFAAAYLIDVVTFSAAYYSLIRLPAMPPEHDGPKAGLASVLEGLRFLKNAPNLRMNFLVDMCAMILAQPRALFPALAYKVYAAGATTVGVLQAAPAVGALCAFVFSGWISKVRWQGTAIVVSVVAYGLAVGGVGLTALVWAGVLGLALSGAADMVSAAYRSTMMQVAAPDEMRGRMQGVFVVVVAGGPRAGDFVAGSLASLTTERWALVFGGTACIVAVLLLAVWQRRFFEYDALDPKP